MTRILALMAVIGMVACTPITQAEIERGVQERSKNIVVSGQEYEMLYLRTTRIIYVNKASGFSPEENLAQVRAGGKPFPPLTIAEARTAALALLQREEGRTCTITQFEQAAPTNVRLEFRC